MSSTTYTRQAQLQRLTVAAGAGVGTQTSILFSCSAEAKPGMDTRAYPVSGRGWSANTHSA